MLVKTSLHILKVGKRRSKTALQLLFSVREGVKEQVSAQGRPFKESEAGSGYFINSLIGENPTFSSRLLIQLICSYFIHTKEN